ncbi:hypothetical protein DV738_g4255, partial [Chaetothyriales sp. CBS 135597]
MATTRRRSNKGVSGSGSGSNQPTLSFSAKSTRVTKPTAARDASLSSSLKKKQQQQQQPTLLKKDGGATEEAEPEPEAVTVQEEFSISIPVRLSPRQQRQPAPTPRTRKILQTTTAATSSLAAVTSRRGREALAEKVTDGQIRKYWQAEEEKRKARRVQVHQESLSVHEKILRHFDISSQYGPCIGISRLARWRRADGLGLDPPVEVLAVLLKQDRSGQGKSGKLAYIDELAGAKENEDR